MNRIADAERRQGVALLATLALMTLLSLMIAIVIRGNMEQRKYLRLRRAQTAALCMAESGVAEALRAIAAQSGETSISLADKDGGEFHVEWSRKEAAQGFYEIRSLGLSNPASAIPARRVVKVRAFMPPGQPPRIVSWTPAAEW